MESYWTSLGGSVVKSFTVKTQAAHHKPDCSKHIYPPTYLMSMPGWPILRELLVVRMRDIVVEGLCSDATKFEREEITCGVRTRAVEALWCRS